MAEDPTAPPAEKSHHGPEYRKGTGPDQLAQGEATQANAAAADIPEPPASPPLPEQGQATPPGLGASPPQAAPPEAGLPPAHVPTTDLEKFLLGPTERPNEPLTPLPAGLSAADFGDWVPAIMEAAQRPDATPPLRAIAQVLVATSGQQSGQ